MGPPSIKFRKVEIFWNKISLTDCKWSSLQAPGTETPVSHSSISFGRFLEARLGRRPNDFLGLSENDRTILFLVVLGEFRIRERPVAQGVLRPVAGECETRL